MKNVKLFSLCFLFIGFCFIGCSDDLLEDPYYEENLKSKKKLSFCTFPFGDYGDAQTIPLVSGVVIRFYNTKMLKFYDPFSRSIRILDPCNMPISYRVGDKVKFSGVEKIPPPHVRLAAPWIVLTSISKI